MNIRPPKSAPASIALYVANQKLTYTDALHQALQQAFRPVDRLGMAELPSAVFDAARYDLVVVVGADAMSFAAADAMNAYLSNRGRVLLLGGPAMEKSHSLNGDPVTLAAYREAVIDTLSPAAKQTLVSMSPDMVFSCANGSAYCQYTGNWGLDKYAEQRYLKVDNVAHWATFQAGATPTVENANVISFYAKPADERTDVFTLEITETSGSRWRLRVPMLSDDWTHYAFTPKEFFYFTGDATARGRMPDFNSIAAVKINFEESYSRIPQGAHSLYLSDITLSSVTDEDFHKAASSLGSLYGVAPLYEQYPITNASEIVADSNQIFVSDRCYVIPTAPNTLISCYSGITAQGYGKNSDTRFIPLLNAKDADGLIAGFAAWMELYISTTPANGSREGAMVACFGASTDEFYNADGIAAVLETATAMTASAFIVDGGTTENTYLADETDSLTAGIRFITLDESAASDAVATVALYEGATLLASYSSSCYPALSLANSIQAIEMHYDLTDGRPDRAVATICLGACEVDRVEQSIHYWSPKPLSDRHYIYTEDGYFKRDGKILNFFGINYFPSYAIATPRPYPSFTSAAGYNSCIVENDLKRICNLGMNAIAIQTNLAAVKSSNNLLDLLRMCEELGLYVDVSLSKAYPLASSLLHEPYHYNAQTVETLIRRLHLHEMDHIIAYDIAWEARVGNYLGGGGGSVNGRHIGRKDWDEAFTAWAKLQYGSLADAQAAWGTDLALTEGNIVITDAMLDDMTGTYRKVIAAYYRFIDEIVSTSMEKHLSHLRELAPNQLISFRMSMSGSALRTIGFSPSVHCFDFQSLASSMAFMQPEGYQLKLSSDSLLQIPFANAYARYTKPQAPVVWKEYGRTVWANREDGNFHPAKACLADAAQYYASVLEHCLQSYTSAIFCWWSISGYRINEESDYGVFNPDGSDRGGKSGITAQLRQFAPKFIGQGERKNISHIAVERDDHTGGIFGMFDAVKEDLAGAHAAGKTVTFTNASQDNSGAYAYADTLLNRYVADAVSASGTAPLRYVNGIIKRCHIVREGEKTFAEITVCNTKQSVWRAGTVSIAPLGYTFAQDVGYLEDITAKIDVSGMSHLALRLEINGVAFGPLFTTTLEE